MQDSKKKEKELAAWEADLKRREKVNCCSNLILFVVVGLGDSAFNFVTYRTSRGEKMLLLKVRNETPNSKLQTRQYNVYCLWNLSIFDLSRILRQVRRVTHCMVCV